MKTGLIVLMSLLPYFVIAQFKGFSIQGKITAPVKTGKVFLSYKTAERKFVRDSLTVTNGTFSFKGGVSEPTLVQLTFRPSGSKKQKLYEFVEFYVYDTVATVQVNSTFNEASIYGGQIQRDFKAYEQTLKPVNSQIGKLNNLFNEAPNKKEKTFIDSMKLEYEKVNIQRKVLQEDYFTKNPNSYFNVIALREIAGSYFDPAKIEPMYNSLNANWKNTVYARELHEKIALVKKTALGTIAPDFELPDVNGKPVKLSDYRGKYVLIDFWASWCGPCREENPHVKAAYNMFKNKGLEILGVSLDKQSQKEAWIKAIHDDALPWTQVCDLQGWKSPVAFSYGIKAIPQNFLINPEGKIVAANLRGAELTKKLEEILK